MSKKISWLEKFAEDQAAKLTKTAALNKKAAQVIVDCDDCPNAQVGQTVTYKNEKYKVVQTDFQDEMGDGVILEKFAEEDEELEMPIEGKTAAFDNVVEELPVEELHEELPEVPGVMNAVTQTVPGGKKVTDAPEKAYVNPGDAYHIEVRDTTEVDGAQSSAATTEQAVVQENSVDRTTVDGHYTWNQNRILDRMVSDMTGLRPVEEVPAEEAPVEEAPVEEVSVEEAPVEEAPVEEAPVEEVQNKFASNKILRKIIGG